MPKKPTGHNGPVHVTETGAEWQPVILSSDKAAAEAEVVSIFSKSLNDPFFKFQDPQQNDENDFDFTIQTNHGQWYLELAEFAPLADVQGGYDNAPTEYLVGDMADKILSVIAKKAAHYSGHKERNLALLIYITHFAFLPSERVISVVRSDLLKKLLPFERIYFLAIIDKDFGAVWNLRPAPLAVLRTIETSGLRSFKLTNFDPRQAVSSNGMVQFQIKNS